MWAARRDDRHLGTVEQGRGWLAVDADSEPIGRFRTLLEAQAAVASPSGRRSPAGPATAAAALSGAATTAFAAGIAMAWPVLVELIR